MNGGPAGVAAQDPVPTPSLAILPVVSWPRTMAPGDRCEMTVDVEPEDPVRPWPFDDEEITVRVQLQSRPVCDSELLTEPAVVLHRFGGTYGPARYLLTASETAPAAGELVLILSNGSGMPFHTLTLPVQVGTGHADTDTDADTDAATRTPTPPRSTPETPATVPASPDLAAFLAAQRQDFDTDQRYLPDRYVPNDGRLVVAGTDHDRVVPDAIGVVSGWLAEPGGQIVIVLGAAGTGTSYLLRRLAARLTDAGMAPVLADLVRAAPDDGLVDVMADQLRRRDVPIRDPRQVDALIGDGRTALLLDHYDAMTPATSYHHAADRLRALLGSVPGNARIVVASRSGWFDSDVQLLTALTLRAAGSGLTVRAIELADFTDEQVETAFRLDPRNRRYPAGTELPPLAHIPACFAPGSDHAFRTAIDSPRGATGYDALLSRFLAGEMSALPRTRETRRTPWPALLDRLATRVWFDGGESLTTSQLRDIVHAVMPDTGDATTGDVMTHLLGASGLMRRVGDGRFALRHESMLEYAVAEAFTRRVADDPQSATALLSRPLTTFMLEIIGELAGDRLQRGLLGELFAGSAGGNVEWNNLLALAAMLQRDDAPLARPSELSPREREALVAELAHVFPDPTGSRALTELWAPSSLRPRWSVPADEWWRRVLSMADVGLVDTSRLLGLAVELFPANQVLQTLNRRLRTRRSSSTIFISYSHQDRDRVFELANRLTEDGFRIWTDRDIHPGGLIREAINRAVVSSRIFLFCLSASSLRSEWVDTEIEMAMARQHELGSGEVYVIPVRLEPCEVPRSLHQFHWVDLFEPGGYDLLTEGLRRLVGPFAAIRKMMDKRDPDIVRELLAIDGLHLVVDGDNVVGAPSLPPRRFPSTSRKMLMLEGLDQLTRDTGVFSTTAVFAATGGPIMTSPAGVRVLSPPDPDLVIIDLARREATLGPVAVVTSDRAVVEQVERAGAFVVRPETLLAALGMIDRSLPAGEPPSPEEDREREQLGRLEALTPRERVVAEHAAAGASNREIASRLFLSVKTVEHHLANIYRKLELTTRTELRSFYQRHQDQG